MTKKINFKLCIGTFFVLLSEARKVGPSREDMRNGIKHDFTEPLLFKALLQIADPQFDAIGDANSAVQKIKSCEIARSEVFKFKEIQEKLHSRIKDNYCDCFVDMVNFAHKYLVMKDETKKDEYLLKALIEVITQDNTINEEQCFTVSIDSRKVKKSELANERKVNFYIFLLDVFNYVLSNYADNKSGQDTYNIWCPQTNETHNKREYIANIGQNSSLDVLLDYSSNIIDSVTFHKEENAHNGTEQQCNDEVNQEFNHINNDNTTVQQQARVIQNGKNNLSITNNGTINFNF